MVLEQTIECKKETSLWLIKRTETLPKEGERAKYTVQTKIMGIYATEEEAKEELRFTSRCLDPEDIGMGAGYMYDRYWAMEGTSVCFRRIPNGASNHSIEFWIERVLMLENMTTN